MLSIRGEANATEPISATSVKQGDAVNLSVIQSVRRSVSYPVHNLSLNKQTQKEGAIERELAYETSITPIIDNNFDAKLLSSYVCSSDIDCAEASGPRIQL